MSNPGPGRVEGRPVGEQPADRQRHLHAASDPGPQTHLVSWSPGEKSGEADGVM